MSYQALTDRVIETADYEVWLYHPHTLELMEILTDFEDLQYRRRTTEPGTFSFEIHESRIDAALIQLRPLVEIHRNGEPDFWGLARKSRYQSNRYRWALSGQDLKWFFGGRRVVPPEDQEHDEFSGAAESALLYYVNRHIGSGAEVSRRLATDLDGPAFIEPGDSGRGSAVVASARYTNLLTVLNNICEAGGIWYEVLVTGGNYALTVHLIQDRTASSPDPLIFSIDLGNVDALTFEVDDVAAPNVLYVLGQGEGLERNVREVQDADRLLNDFRREDSHDARTMSLDASLDAEGARKLAEIRNRLVRADFDLSARAGAEYRDTWDLGMTVTFEIPDFGITLDADIVEVAVQLQSDGGERIGLRIGDRPRTIQREIRALAERAAQVSVT